MKKIPLVTVVMSNYNGVELKLLPEALDSILKNTYPKLEVILVDNASTDNSVAAMKIKFDKNPHLKIVKNPVNIYSSGLNLGIQKATGEYVAFFNNDVFVGNNFFTKIINYLENNQDVALIQGKIVSYYNNSIIDSAGETMDESGNPITIGAGSNALKSYNKICEVLSVSGSCSILRKSSVNKIGYFDEDYGIGYEDLDLAIRVHLTGLKVIYYPDALAFHKRAATDVAPNIRPKVKWHFNKNRLITLIKNYPLYLLLKNLPIVLMIYLFAGFWEIFIKKSPKVGIKRLTSIVWVIFHLPKILKKRTDVGKISDRKRFSLIEKMMYKKILIQSFLTFLKIKEPG